MRRGRPDGALRRALPRERRPRAADPAPPARAAHAALAAAAEGAEPAAGRAQVRLVPGRPRDLPRVPAGRLRPAGAAAAARTGLRSRELDLVDVETASASPYAASLLFDYIATYMYEDDTPPAERRAQALSLDRDLLRELLGQEELRDLLDPDAIEEVEAQLARRAEERRRAARPAPAARPPLRGRVRRGLRRDAAPRAPRGHAADRRRARRSPPPRTPAATATRSARCRPAGCPRRSSSRRRSRCDARWRASRAAAARSRRREAAERFGLDRDRVEPELRALEREERLVRGELRPGGTEREWCDPDVLRRLRRASLAALRREVEPAEQAALGRFLPGWHGIDRRASLREALVPLQGLALPVALWETEVLPRRVSRTTSRCSSTSSAPRASSSGSGAGLDRVAVYFREDAPVLGRPARGGAAGGHGARGDPARARPQRGVLARPRSPRPASRPRRCCPRSGISSGPAR